ncbi:LIM domain-binding protein 3 [Cichlidogyrus casuarinus]|uniref:LIM domain-binding protein 3 n=1 Tax=Cichlidogyrus casuarinus TaxID=1844966 RepID=A0ABD2QKE3_9PLAT
MSIYIGLRRPDSSHPWGFRIQGGTDFYQPLTIESVKPGSIADRHGVRPGDRVVRVGGDPTSYMTHQQAQQSVIRCGNELSFDVVRGSAVHSDRNLFDHHATTKATLTMHYNPSATSPRSVETSSFFGGSSPRSLSSTISSESPNRHQPSSNYMSPSLKMALDPGNKFHTPDSPSSPAPYVPPHRNTSQNYSSSPTSIPNLLKAVPKPKSKTVGSSQPRVGRVGAPSLGSSNCKPVCYQCKIDIRGPYLAALEFCFCPGHFKCNRCSTDLGKGDFVEQDGVFHCEPCFKDHLAPRCAACKAPVVGTVVTALEKKWHSSCFVCEHCGKALGESVFRVGEDSKHYCDEHWKQLFQICCDKCAKPIEEIDRFLAAFGKNFHAQCFQCAACQCPLEGKPFHPRDGKAFCKAHANAVAIY